MEFVCHCAPAFNETFHEAKRHFKFRISFLTEARGILMSFELYELSPNRTSPISSVRLIIRFRTADD